MAEGGGIGRSNTIDKLNNDKFIHMLKGEHTVNKGGGREIRQNTDCTICRLIKRK